MLVRVNTLLPSKECCIVTRPGFMRNDTPMVNITIDYTTIKLPYRYTVRNIGANKQKLV